MNLPHDTMIYEKRSKTSEAGGANGYFPGGKYIYSKKFQAPSEWQMKDVAIEFEAVYQNSEDKAFFKKVVYEPGMLKVVSYDANGNKLAESELISATGESRLSLSAEKTTLSANGQDLLR